LATYLQIEDNGDYDTSVQMQSSASLGFNENCIQTEFKQENEVYDIYETDNQELVLYINNFSAYSIKRHVFSNY